MTSSYQQQLDAKVERISAQFAEFNPPSLEVFNSPEQNFRMRAEFRIWHTEDDMFYAMFERNEDDKQKTVVRIDEFPIADQSINDLMPPVSNGSPLFEMLNLLFPLSQTINTSLEPASSAFWSNSSNCLPLYSFVSSSMIRELAAFDGDITPFVPEEVSKRVYEKYKQS